MKRWVLFLLVIVGWPLAGFGQAATSQKGVQMFLDYSRFRYDKNETYLEVYYMLYDVDGDSDSSGGEGEQNWLNFSLKDVENDSLLATSEIPVTLDGSGEAANDPSNARGSLIKTVLPPGKYNIKMVRCGADKVTPLDSLHHTITVQPFDEKKIALSDIELCSRIITNSTNKNGLFYKNTMEVFPNPTGMYGTKTPVLYYYTELYNVKGKNPDDEITIDVAIANTEGEVLQQKKYTRNRANESLVEIGAFNVSKLKSGLYTLVFAVTEPKENYSIYTRSNFLVVSSRASSSEDEDFLQMFAQSEYANMNEDELDTRFAQTRYIIPEHTIRVYESMDDLGSKRLLLFKFWYDREKEGLGQQAEYYERVAYATENFPYANIPGWRSDRGRIYIKYGKPDQITRKPNNPHTRPHEIWTYHNLEGGSRFLFVDETGFGDYKLKSSTYRQEIYDPQWDSYFQDEFNLGQ